MNDLNCPAQTRGIIGTCRFCIFVSGGPSALCLKLAERHNREQAQLLQQSSTNSSVTPVSLSDSQS